MATFHMPWPFNKRQWRYEGASRPPKAVGQNIHVHARAGSEGVESDDTQTIVETGGNGGGTGDGAGEVESNKTERQPEEMAQAGGSGVETCGGGKETTAL